MSVSSLLSRSSKAFRASTLVIVGVIVGGASFAVASSDIIYGSESLLAAATSAFSSSPMITISRNSQSPGGEIAQGVLQTVGVFDVKPTKNVSGTFLSSVKADITVNTSKAGLKMSRFIMQYGYCLSGECRTLDIPIASVVEKGLAYKLTSGQVMLPVYVESERPGAIYVFATPYYTTPYVSGPKTASIKADIRDAAATGATFKTVSYGYQNSYSYNKMSVGPIKVRTGLAYGKWLRISRSYGYGY